MAATYQLFMGRNIPGGDYVTDEGFNKFLHIVDTIVDGYTVYDAQGVWEGEHEDCKVMTVSCTDEQVNQIARTYKQAFSQLAVGLVQLPSMEFV
jgi:hypothetical protein